MSVRNGILHKKDYALATSISCLGVFFGLSVNPSKSGKWMLKCVKYLKKMDDQSVHNGVYYYMH